MFSTKIFDKNLMIRTVRQIQPVGHSTKLASVLQKCQYIQKTWEVAQGRIK
jgi:hypothetical protein